MKLSALFCILSWFAYAFSGPVEYLQYVLLKSVPFSSGILFFVTALFSISFLLLEKIFPKKFSKQLYFRGNKSSKSSLYLVSFLPVLISLLSFFAGVIGGFNNASFIQYIKGYYIYILTPVLGTIVSHNYLNSRFWLDFYRICLLLFLPIGALGILQAISNNLIIDATLINDLPSTELSEGKSLRELPGYVIYGGYFLGQNLRATSFYRSPFDFGIISLLFLFVSVYYFLSFKSKRFLLSTIIVFSLSSAILTFVRNVQLSLLLGFSFILLMSYTRFFARTKKSNQGKLKLLNLLVILFPFISFIFVLIITGATVSLLVSNSTQSLLIRYETWSRFLSIAFDFLPYLLFGNGELQPQLGGDLLIFDNTFVAFASFSGLIFLLFFIYLYFYLYRRAVRYLLVNQSHYDFFWLGYLTLFACYPCLSLLNNLIGGWPFFALPIYLLISTKQRMASQARETLLLKPLLYN
jgi:hypothetical protein